MGDRGGLRRARSGRDHGALYVRYTDDSHFVSGDRGVSDCLLSGTTAEGERVEVRGCDIWLFEGDNVARKDSYWKVRTG